MSRLVIFDLDGTLLETIGDLSASCNAVLRARNMPEHTYDEYRTFVGNGVRKLVERALPEDLRSEELIDAVCAEFKAYYTAHIDCFSETYAGIRELLAALMERGVKVAIVSNKFQAGTELLARKFFPEIPFVAVYGQREGVPLKPDPTADLEVMRLAGSNPATTYHLGDTASDVKAALAAGIRAVGVSWGFRRREELMQAGAHCVIDHPMELLDFMDK